MLSPGSINATVSMTVSDLLALEALAQAHEAHDIRPPGYFILRDLLSALRRAHQTALPEPATHEAVKAAHDRLRAVLEAELAAHVDDPYAAVWRLLVGAADVGLTNVSFELHARLTLKEPPA